jgi:transcriptional regulator with XRE-family HTH domain
MYSFGMTWSCRLRRNEAPEIQRFGEKLHILRLRQGMTLRDLTRALGYAGSGYISEVETGKRAPMAEFVLKVARLFNVSADRLKG